MALFNGGRCHWRPSYEVNDMKDLYTAKCASGRHLYIPAENADEAIKIASRHARDEAYEVYAPEAGWPLFSWHGLRRVGTVNKA